MSGVPDYTTMEIVHKVKAFSFIISSILRPLINFLGRRNYTKLFHKNQIHKIQIQSTPLFNLSGGVGGGGVILSLPYALIAKPLAIATTF